MPVSRIKNLLAIRMAVTVTALVALSGVSAARDKTCAPVRNEAVVDALNQLFEAASHDDDKLFNEVLAPNFYAFDNGKRFDGMQLPQLINSSYCGLRRLVTCFPNDCNPTVILRHKQGD